MKSSRISDELTLSPRAIHSKKRTRISAPGSPPPVRSSMLPSRTDQVAAKYAAKAGLVQPALSSIVRHGVRAVREYQEIGDTIVVDHAAYLRQQDLAEKQEALERENRVTLDVRAEKMEQIKLLQQTFQEKLARLKKLGGNSESEKQKSPSIQTDIIVSAKKDLLGILTEGSIEMESTWKTEKGDMEKRLAEVNTQLQCKEAEVLNGAARFERLSVSYKRGKTQVMDALAAKRMAHDGVRSRDKTIEDLRLKVQSLTNSENDLNQQFKALRASENTLRTAVQYTEAANDKLRGELDGQCHEIEKHNAECRKMEGLRAALLEEKAFLAEQLRTAEKANSMLNSRSEEEYAERIKLAQSLKDLIATNADLKDQVTSVSEEKAQVSRHLGAAGHTQAALTRDLQESQGANLRLVAQTRVLDAERGSLAEEKAAQTDQLRLSQQARAGSEAQTRALDSQRAILVDEKAALAEQLRLSQQARSESEAQIRTLDSQKATLLDEKAALAEQLRLLKQREVHLTDRVSSTASQKSALAEEITNLTKQLQRSRSVNTELTDRVNSLDTHRTALAQEKVDLVQDLRSSESACSVATEEVQALTEKLHHLAVSKQNTETELESLVTKSSTIERVAEILICGIVRLSDFEHHGLEIATNPALDTGGQQTVQRTCSSFHGLPPKQNLNSHDIFSQAFRVLLRVNRRIVEPRELLDLWQSWQSLGEEQKHLRNQVLIIVFQLSRISLENEPSWTLLARVCTDICHSLRRHLHHDKMNCFSDPPKWVDVSKQWRHIDHWKASCDDTEASLLSVTQERIKGSACDEELSFGAEADLGRTEVSICVEAFSNSDVLLLVGRMLGPLQIIVTRLRSIEMFMARRRFWVGVREIGLGVLIWRVSKTDMVTVKKWFQHRARFLDKAQQLDPLHTENWK